MRLFIFISFIIFFCACSCRTPGSIEDDFNKADAVFFGILSKAENTDEGVIYSFTLIDSWKGIKEARVKVRSARNEAACGITLRPGDIYLVFANFIVNSNTSAASYTVSLCSRTKDKSKASEDLEYLKGKTKLYTAPALAG